MDDALAIRRLKRGDIGGLEWLIARYQVKAVRIAYLITHNEPLAEDVVQDAFLRLLHGIRNFDECRAFEPYFLRSVVNTALNVMRRERYNADPIPDDNVDGLEQLLISAGSVEDQVVYNQLKNQIAATLERLSPRQRAVVVQRYYLGMSEKEMAEALDAPPGTIKRLLNNARSRLQALLSSERSAQ